MDLLEVQPTYVFDRQLPRSMHDSNGNRIELLTNPRRAEAVSSDLVAHLDGGTKVFEGQHALDYWLNCPARFGNNREITERGFWDLVGRVLALEFWSGLFLPIGKVKSSEGGSCVMKIPELPFLDRKLVTHCTDFLGSLQGLLVQEHESLIPSPVTPIDWADKALQQTAPLNRSLLLSIAVALGQESFIHAKVSQESEQDEVWISKGIDWLNYLHMHFEETIDYPICLTHWHDEFLKLAELPNSFRHSPLGNVNPRMSARHDDNREKFKSTWLPVSTIRTITHSIRSKRARGGRSNFTTRFGLSHPWMKRREEVTWIRFGQPLDTEQFLTGQRGEILKGPWLRCLAECCSRIIAYHASNAESSRDSFETLKLPWHYNALASTFFVSRALGFRDAVKLLNASAAGNAGVGCIPNDVFPPASRPLQNETLFGGVKTTPIELFDFSRLCYNEQVKETISVPRDRNLAGHVIESVKSHRKYERIVRFEAEIMRWWRPLLFNPEIYMGLYDWGNEWPGDDELVNLSKAQAPDEVNLSWLDHPPSRRISGGWLKAVIAYYARNGKCPEYVCDPGPIGEQLFYPDAGNETYHEDTHLSSPYDDSFPEKSKGRTDDGHAGVVFLSVLGWFLKPEARARILDWLECKPPTLERPPNWEYAQIFCAIASAHFIHRDGEKDSELIEAFKSRINQIEEMEEDEKAARTAMWLKRFFDCSVPFPKRPKRER